MQFIGILLTILLLNTSQAAPKSRCSTLLSHKTEANLTKSFETHLETDLEAFRQQSYGQWVELKSGQWVRYQIWGESGPVHLHFEGIGMMVEETMESSLAQVIAKKQRLLVIELDGQGLNEVHRRLQLEQIGDHPTREIPYFENVDILWESLPKIMEKEAIEPSELTSFSGHSYGGQALAGFAHDMNSDSNPTFQFLATGVTNFNNRLLNHYTNSSYKILNSFASIIFPQAGTIKIEKGADSIPEEYLEDKFKNDRIQLESMVALTLGADHVDTTNMVRDFPKNIKVQIFSAENDQLLFHMLHWELSLAAQQAGLHTSLVMVDGVDHYLPQNLSSSQAKTIEAMRLAPQEYGSFYRLNRRGKLIELTEAEADALFREKSLILWEQKKDELYETFGLMGEIPKYPASWR